MKQIDYSLYYKRWHNDSLEHYEKMVDYYKFNFFHILPENKDIQILDVGAGFGFLIYALNRAGFNNVRGIDISPQMVMIATSKGLNVELVEDSKEYLEKHNGEFDIIFALDVLEHIPVDNQIDFLKSIYNALKDDGKFICTVPNANSSFASRWRYIDWTHHCSFTEHSLEFVLLNSGFKKVRVQEIEFFKKPKYPFIIRKSVIHWLMFKTFRFFRRLEAIAELGIQGKTIPLSLNIMGIAEK